ncbi:MAG: Xaa-Pro peptidase family protein, partial [Chthonomonadales bacterium]
MSIYDNRISQLQSAMATRGVDMVVLAPTNHMKYLSGWCESGHERLLAMFVPATGNPIFVVPSLNAEQCKTNPAGFTDVRGWNDSTGWHEVVRPILSGNKFCIDDELDSVHLMGFQSIAPNAKYDPATPLVSVLREIKSADEIELMMATAAVTDTVFANSVSQLNAGMTEKEFEAIITAEYAKFGTRPQFSIIGFGPNGALPHHHTGSRTLQSGDVIIIDIGCELAGYQSDITRTVAFGEPSNEAKKVYSVVHGAFLAAMNFARPGVTCESVDKASRDVIDAAGYG